MKRASIEDNKRRTTFILSTKPVVIQFTDLKTIKVVRVAQDEPCWDRFGGIYGLVVF